MSPAPFWLPATHRRHRGTQSIRLPGDMAWATVTGQAGLLAQSPFPAPALSPALLRRPAGTRTTVTSIALRGACFTRSTFN